MLEGSQAVGSSDAGPSPPPGVTGVAIERGDREPALGPFDPQRRARSQLRSPWAVGGGGNLEPAVEAYLREVARKARSSRAARRGRPADGPTGVRG
jgi:hypothetical protein